MTYPRTRVERFLDRRSGTLAAVAALVCAACGAREVRTVDLASSGLDYAFLATLDGAGVPVRVSATAGVRDGRLAFGRAALTDLSDGERAVVLVGLPRAALAGAFPAFDSRREHTVRARLEVPRASPVLESRPGEEVVLGTALPAGARFFVVGAGGELMERDASDPSMLALSAAITLSVPMDHQRCGKPDEAPLLPFGPTENAVPGVMVEEMHGINFLRVARVDADRAIAMTSARAFLLERGARYEPLAVSPLRRGNLFAPSALLALTSTLTGTMLHDMALDRRAGTFILTTIGLDARGGDVAVSRMWTVIVTPQGLELAGTSTIVADLRALAVHPRTGQRAFVGPQGEAYLLDAGARLDAAVALPPIPVPPDGQHFPTRVVFTGDDAEPIVVAASGGLYVYDAASSAWRTTELGFADLRPGTVLDPGEARLFFDAFAVFPGEVWAGGTAGAVFRRAAGGEWTRVDALAPPTYGPCSRTTRVYPDMVISDRIDDMVAAGEHVYFTIRSCSAIVEVRRADLCTRMVAVGGDEPGPSYLHDLQAIDLADDHLVVAGEQGLVYDRAPTPP